MPGSGTYSRGGKADEVADEGFDDQPRPDLILEAVGVLALP